MQVSKWGNSLAIRLPASVVEALALQEGDDIEIRVVGDREFEVVRPVSKSTLLARLDKFKGRLPADFKWGREELNERN